MEYSINHQEEAYKKAGVAFKKGDWVNVYGTGSITLDGILCLVTGTRKGEVLLKAYKDQEGKAIDGKCWFDIENVVMAPIIENETDIRAMIDLALDLNDRNWFDELIQKLEGLNGETQDL